MKNNCDKKVIFNLTGSLNILHKYSCLFILAFNLKSGYHKLYKKSMK